MTKLDDILLGVGSIAFAMSGVYTYITDNFLKDQTEIQAALQANKKNKKKYRKYEKDVTAAGAKAGAIKNKQRAIFFFLWVAGLVLSVLSLTI
jgi:hypothetical protein